MAARPDAEAVRLYILKHISDRDKGFVAKTCAAFGVSRTTVYNHLRKMAEEGMIARDESKKPLAYSLTSERRSFRYRTADGLDEDRVFRQDIAPLISQLDQNVYDIWSYSFTEMMNNAIDHANADEICCSVTRTALFTSMAIHDDGVGIFRRIQSYFMDTLGENITLDESVAALFAGKLTTDRARHTGQGIYFTSRAVDSFIIYSQGKIFTRDVFSEELFDAEAGKVNAAAGTIVLMRQANVSNKELSDIMNLYADPDKGFFRTQLPIAHIFSGGYPVSRSEAKRLGSMIQRFEEVTLDFEGVRNLGQGFAHELFVVFHSNHPNIALHCLNMAPAVESMIRSVQNTVF